MQVHTYQPADTPPADVAEWLVNQYGSSPSSKLFLQELYKAYTYTASNPEILFVPFTAHQGSVLQGHCALILDRRLPSDVAFFGFLEFHNNALVFEALWQRLCTEARRRGIATLQGPISGSIWHQYRCLSQSDGSAYYRFEPQSPSYYVDYLRSRTPTQELGYHSAYREQYDNVLKRLQTAVARSDFTGFTVQASSELTRNNLETIVTLSKATFHGSWGYTPLETEDFLALYPPDELRRGGVRLYLLCAGTEAIGFCAVVREVEQTLIVKTIAILPEYQRRGLGTLLAYTIHRDAQRLGVKKIIYALVRDDNSIQHFPSVDLVTFRRYAAFEFTL